MREYASNDVPAVRESNPAAVAGVMGREVGMVAALQIDGKIKQGELMNERELQQIDIHHTWWRSMLLLHQLQMMCWQQHVCSNLINAFAAFL